MGVGEEGDVAETADAWSMTRRTRSPTCSTVSPPDTLVVQIDQPGCSACTAAVVRPS